MMKDLKKNIILFCCLGLFSACSTTVIDKPDTGNAIKFVSTTTRAAIENDFPDGSSFSVWGWYINPGGARNDVFTKTPVTKNGYEWGYEGTQFWIQDNTYNFYAIYPENFGTVEQDGTIKVENFDCSKTGDGAVDLMTAKNTGLSGSSSSTVHLQFKHELARVFFVAKSHSGAQDIEGYDPKVQKASLYGMFRTGDLTVSFVNDNATSQWNVPSNKNIGEEATDKSTPLVVSNDEIKVDDAEGVTVIEALVFPQQIKTGYNIDLEYRTSDNSSLRQVTVDLSSLSVNEWNAGNQYRYSFTITPDDRILFDKPTVNKWDEATGGIIIVE